MAMGVVTLFGASEMTTGFEAPSSCAVTTAETIPTTQPTVCESKMGINCLRMTFNC